MRQSKRILALSGGGVRGIVEVAFLEAVEKVYQQRHGADTRLCDVFDLIGGTSTGALIATALSLGQPMSQVADFYLTRAANFFAKPRWHRFGWAPVFDCAGLEREFRADVGAITLGDPRVLTYLAIVTKRLDTGSSWIVNNIPTAPYYDDPADGSYRGNRHYELALLLRAATAAPTYFSPQQIEIAKGQPPGVFVDGGLSPHNDPSLALLMLARMSKFGLNWPLGQDNLFVLSVGAGRYRHRLGRRPFLHLNPLRLAYAGLRGMVCDAEQHTLMMMEWLGHSQAPSDLNSEIGALEGETMHASAMFAYQRLDLPLEGDDLRKHGLDVSDRDAARLRSMEDPQIIVPIYQLAQEYIAGLDLQRMLN